MKRIFADTSFFQALINERDAHHEDAVALFDCVDAVLVTTDCVLLELGALLSHPLARPLFVEFVRNFRDDPFAEILPLSFDLFEGGFTLFASRPDKEWSLADCISFEAMRRNGITTALTYDHHFEQAGFQIKSVQ